MSRYIDPKCRVCRRAGVKLFLKGTRCFSPKCPIERRGGQPPGMHKDRRRQLSEYGTQLFEKQKVKALYGVTERQFRRYFDKALKVRGATGEALIQLLERRLDNAVFRLGLTPSRSVARQLVSHGHVAVDGKTVTIPSLSVKPGMVVSVDAVGLAIPQVAATIGKSTGSPAPWLERKAAVGRIIRLPERSEAETGINEQLIVEYYSR